MKFIEWYLGIPPAGPGEGMTWALRSAAPFDPSLPAWLVGLLAVAVVGLVVAIYWKDGRALPWHRRVGLVILRMASLAVLAIMLGRVSLAVTQTGLPTLAILIDTSASMGLEDRFRDREAMEAAERFSTVGSERPPSRLDLAKGLLTSGEGRFLADLQRTHRLQVYEFAAAAAPLIPATESEGELAGDPLIDAIRGLEADGEATRPAAAVRQVLDDLRGNPPAALLVLTDGITTTGDEDRLIRVADEARARSIPLIPIGFGSDEPLRDVQLAELLADDVVFVDDPVTFSVQLKAYGYAGRGVTVTLKREDGRSVLDSVDVELGADGQPSVVELTDVPAEEGDAVYVVEAVSLPGETDEENNLAVHRVRVRQEQLKVLLVEREPRWEFRHLKPLLERDPAVQLHTVLQSADLSYPAEDVTGLPRFPVSRDVLFSYDVVIIGDIDLEYLSAGALAHLREFVAERGGGLILIAGPAFNPHSYRETPLSELLPVEPGSQETAAERSADIPFRPRPTVEGRTRAALRLTGSSDEQDRMWESLPPLFWLQETGRRKPGAQVLLEHPTLRNEWGPLPVVVSQRFGAGQVLFHATDELWRWRQRVEDRYYGRYWLQMIRYLSRSKLRGGDRGLELVSDRRVYSPGEAVELHLRILDPGSGFADGTTPQVVVEGPGGRRESVALAVQPLSPMLLMGRVSGLPAGRYHAWLSTPARRGISSDDPTEERSSVPSVDFRVEDASGELQLRDYQAAELVEAAQKSRGTYYPFWEAQRFLSEVPPGRSVPISSEHMVSLWNRWELLVLFAGLLAVEWISRKRCGLV